MYSNMVVFSPIYRKTQKSIVFYGSAGEWYGFNSGRTLRIFFFLKDCKKRKASILASFISIEYAFLKNLLVFKNKMLLKL